jgi:hypothetical protein
MPNIGNATPDGQYIIDTTPPGQSLNSAFVDVNLNFDQVWATGLVNSNIQIGNNTIYTNNTNGDLVLNPNGIGIVQSNVSILPNQANIRNLGSATQRWATVYTQYLDVSANLNIAGNIIYNGDLVVDGNLTVQGNIIQIGNIVTDSKTIQLANTATTDAAANGSGITVGATDDIATLLYNSGDNVWTTNIGLQVGGPVTGTSLAVSSATVYGNIAAINSNFTGSVSANTVSATGNVTGAYIKGDGSQLTNLPTGNYSNANVIALMANFGSNVISATGNITAGNVTGQQLWAQNGVVFNSRTIAQSFTLDGYNAESVGPVDIAAGVVIEITNGDWVIL